MNALKFMQKMNFSKEISYMIWQPCSIKVHMDGCVGQSLEEKLFWKQKV